MKRVGVVLLMAALIVYSFSVVLAAEAGEGNSVDAEIDEQTQAEVEVMDVSHGAEMRLLQLEFRIRRAILQGEAVIDFLKGNGSDTSELEAIVEELNILVEEVKDISVVRGDQEAVDKYVEVKKDAIELVKDFREKARTLLGSEEEISSLREQFNNIDRTQLSDLREEIKQRIRMLNAVRARKVLELFGSDDEELIARIESGNMSASQIRERLRGDYNALNAQSKEALKNRIREEVVRVRLLRVDRVSKARMAMAENAVQRYENRARRLESIGFTRAGERLRERASALQTERDEEMKSGITARGGNE